MSHPLSEGGEFCAICERTIEWDGHSEVEHLKARVRELEERLEDAERPLEELRVERGLPENFSGDEIKSAVSQIIEGQGLEGEVERLRAALYGPEPESQEAPMTDRETLDAMLRRRPGLDPKERGAIRSLLEDYDKQGRDLEDLMEQRDVVMRREAALKERLNYYATPHPCPICTPIHEENERQAETIAVQQREKSHVDVEVERQAQRIRELEGRSEAAEGESLYNALARSLISRIMETPAEWVDTPGDVRLRLEATIRRAEDNERLRAALRMREALKGEEE